MDSMIEADRYCKVCGDKAVYVNYGALTCDSCKTFFRRQNLHPKNLTCNYNGRCMINAKTRKDCTKCRLIKCFAIGMRSDVIGSATSERQRKSSLARFSGSCNEETFPVPNYVSHPYKNGDHLLYHSHSRGTDIDLPVENPGSDSGSNSSDEQSRRVLNSLNHDQTESSHRPPTTNHYTRIQSESIDTMSSGESFKSIKFQEYKNSLLPLNHLTNRCCYTKNLNPVEVLHIEAVKDAAAAIRSRVFITDDAKCTKPIIAAMKLQSFGIDKLISGMSRIQPFSQLDDMLKAILLKGAIAEMMLVRSSMHFDPKINGWTINAIDVPGNNQCAITSDINTTPQLSIVSSSPEQHRSPLPSCSPSVPFHLSLETFKHIPGATEWVDDYIKFCELLDKSWKEDEVLITLLMVLILFNPENVQMHQVKEIKYQQTYFQFMLKRYLETSCDTLSDAAAAFDRLKQARKLVRRLKNSFENTVLYINPEEMCSSNRVVTTDQTQTHRNQFVSEPFSKISIPNGINETSLTVEVESKRNNPFGPRMAVACSNPSGYWKKYCGPTDIDQCSRSSNVDGDIVMD